MKGRIRKAQGTGHRAQRKKLRARRKKHRAQGTGTGLAGRVSCSRSAGCVASTGCVVNALTDNC